MPPSRCAGQSRFSKAQRKCISALVFGLLAPSSCTNTVANREDQDRISGFYVLTQVDGLAIPIPVAPQQGCNRTVRKGVFSISKAGSDVLPMYDWTISIDPGCQPIPAGVGYGADDVGTWSFNSSTNLSFKSMKGRGAYSATLEETSGNPPAISFAYLGNTYRFVRLMRFDDPQGVVFVKVVDQNGQLVPGVVLIYTFANGLQDGGTTPASGEIGTRGVVGECKISITPPAGYEVPASQPNPVLVNVVQGPAIRIQVSLRKL